MIDKKIVGSSFTPPAGTLFPFYIQDILSWTVDELLQKLMKQNDEVKQQACYTVSQKEKAIKTQLEEVASVQSELRSIV